MDELRAIQSRVNPAEVLLVVDAMIGQEAVNIAKGFREVIPLTGLILTKMDGDARGGAAISIRSVTGCADQVPGNRRSTGCHRSLRSRTGWRAVSWEWAISSA